MFAFTKETSTDVAAVRDVLLVLLSLEKPQTPTSRVCWEKKEARCVCFCCFSVVPLFQKTCRNVAPHLFAWSNCRTGPFLVCSSSRLSPVPYPLSVFRPLPLSPVCTSAQTPSGDGTPPPPSSSGLSSCWSGDETVAAAVEEGADKVAVTQAHEHACLVGDDDSSDTADTTCAGSPTVVARSSEASGLEPAEGSPANTGVRRGGSAGVDVEGLLGNTVLLSVSGGLKDLRVHPSLTIADGLGLEGQSVSLTTEAMEECGFDVDHKALVWCKQVVSRCACFASGMIDRSTRHRRDHYLEDLVIAAL